MARINNLEEIRLLSDQARQFQNTLRRLTEGTRFRRSPERALEFRANLRRARTFLELAERALEGRDTDQSDDGPRPEGWLQSKVANLARYLAGGVQADAAKPLPGKVTASELEAIGEREHALRTRTEGGFGGACSSIGVPDLLAMMQAMGKTGVLRVSHPNEDVLLHFEDGDLVHAFSERTPGHLRLGELLVQQGALDRERLESVLFCQPGEKRLGDVLTEGRIVTEEQLEAAVAHQVQQLFHRMFGYHDATFRFEPGLPPVDEGSRARRNVIQLLLESARHNDESARGDEGRRQAS